MANFEYDFNDKDYQLVANTVGQTLSNNDYIRIIVYSEDGEDIVNLTESGNQAIFYSSLSDIPFEINISPFGAKLNETLSKTIGGDGDGNDFKIYKKIDETIYLKPNEILNTFGLPEGRYKLQIDFLNQLNEKINIRFETITVNNVITKNGPYTIHGDTYPITEIETPLFLSDTGIPQIPFDENNFVISPLNDNLIYWSDNTISIEDIRTYFSPLEINTNDDYLETLLQPENFQELNISQGLSLTEETALMWESDSRNRPDLAEMVRQIIDGNIPPPPEASFNGYTIPNNGTHPITWQHIEQSLSTPWVFNAGFVGVITRIERVSTGQVVNITSDVDLIAAVDFLFVPGEEYRFTNGLNPEEDAVISDFTFNPTILSGGIVTLSPDNTAGIRPFETFYNNIPMKVELPIKSVYSIGGVTTYNPALGWLGSIDNLEQGKYYTIHLDESVEDDYQIDLNQLRQDGVHNLSGPHLFTPQNETLVDDFYRFIIKEISTSRKEVRLKLIDKNIDGTSPEGKAIINNIIQVLNNGTEDFQFNHKLNVGTGKNLPIMNYVFDTVTDGRKNQSIILKLYKPLPTSINNLSNVTIEQERLITQVQDITYFSDVEEESIGDGLTPDYQENWIVPDQGQNEFETYNELSASLSNISLHNFISESIYNYPNLNTDYSEFKNHTHFGSAKSKLVNFKNKVETIQGYYTEISQSLSAKGVSFPTDSNILIKKRKNLFDKINKEIQSFTPYERFLYFDGQIETTASAPGLTRNYAHSQPIRVGGPTERFNPLLKEQINLGDGFDTVYYLTNENAKDSELDYFEPFQGLYKFQDKPFFNYSSSIYLSFLMKGDSGSTITHQNNNNLVGGAITNGAILPHDIFHTSSLVNPIITGSEYRKFIFKVSSSYWIPTNKVPYVDASRIDVEGFGPNSNQIEVISGSSKVSSTNIRSDEPYSSFSTVVTQSGAPFKGSFMPAGDMFALRFNYHPLSSSLQGYWNIDDVTSGSSLSLANVVNDAGPTTGDATDILGVTASAGVEVHGRQYGSSYFMISESGNNTGVHFDSTDFNFSKDDNFSLSVWVKRFHPNGTSSLNPTIPASTNAQGIFIRGNAENSYGIEYRHVSNQFRCGVRPTSDGNSKRLRSHTMTDSGSNWHHVVMTYESASATGIKLYVDGVLEGSTTNITDGNGDVMGDFSASNANADVGEKLSLGGDDILAGSRGVFNGFLQYPRVYDRAITAEEVNQLYLKPDGKSETKITDIKISLKNPTDVLPFDNLYHTSSAAWTNWYNGMITDAESFDENNIHSLENNLPTYIQESSEYNEFKDFLSMQGEQYDLIKNHVDSLSTIHDRGYKKSDSPPTNTYPMLLESLGYDSTAPFTGDLSETLGSYLSSVTSIDDIKNNTWRKTLNNLLYIYKSKGTKNAVRGLFNIYGYPPDVLKIQEFGSSNNFTDANSPINNVPPVDDGLDNYRTPDTILNTETGSFGYLTRQQKLYHYNFSNNKDRVLNLDWWMNDANINSLEFVYKHNNSTANNTIIMSSGSGTENLWDLRLVPSSDGASSSFEFRLNNTETGSSNISANAYSMSTNYVGIGDGQLWNVMLQRMTSSAVGNGAGNVEYRLHASLQRRETIQPYLYVTMSISGGVEGGTTEGGKGFYANQNWASSGSRQYTSASNLIVGHELSGSLSEVKAWNTPLSTSKFRQHTLNKFSTVGNTINSYKTELLYHFKLNENYSTASVSSSTQELIIADSAPKCSLTTNYSIQKSANLFTSSLNYGYDIVDTVKLGFKDNNTSNENDNGIIINQTLNYITDLNPNTPATDMSDIYNNNKPGIITSNKLELYLSPQDAVNTHILNTLDTFNFEDYYGNPVSYHSSSYTEFDTLRKNFFKCNPIEVDVNKYIRAHENIFNTTVVDAVKKSIPARSTLSDKDSNVGVSIKPNILEKQKHEVKKHTLEVNPNTGTASIDIVSVTNVISSEFEDGNLDVKEGTVQSAPSTIGSYEVPHTASISLGNNYVTSSGYLKNSPAKNHNHPPFLQPGGYSSSIFNPYTASFTWTGVSTGPKIIPPSLSGSSLELPKTGSIDYASIANESFKNIHNSWGVSDSSGSDTHFINYAGGTSSRGDYNVAHIDTRFHFYSIGETEKYSGSAGNSDDFSNISRFSNRQVISDGLWGDINHESYINGNPGIQSGVVVGKTRYFYTASNGDIILPSNHVSKFVDNYLINMRNGAQNTNPGQLPFAQEDYSTASFYRVRVTGGENQIRIQSGIGNIDDDKIIYN